MSHLTLPVLTELAVVFGAGAGGILETLVLTWLRHTVDVWFGLHAVVLPVFILAPPHVFDVYLQLLQTGSFSDVTRRFVRHAVAAAHRVIVVSVTHDVTHAQHILRVFVALGSKFAVSTF